MKAIILAAIHDKQRNSEGLAVPVPLLDLGGRPMLTASVERLMQIPGLSKIFVVTNDTIKEELDQWHHDLNPGREDVAVMSDGTQSPIRIGAVGDILFALEKTSIKDDLLVVGGDNWFTFDIQEFVIRSQNKTPSVAISPIRDEGLDKSRFGMVKIRSNSRIEQFIEKPDSGDLKYKACCLYFFSSADLRWFHEFAKDHSCDCSPGSFFAWLAERTPAYGIPMEGSWYNISPSSPRDSVGPDYMEIRSILREQYFPKATTWAQRAAEQMQWVSSYVDLLDLMHVEDPNRRIVAIDILGRIGKLLDEKGRKQVVSQLLLALNDSNANQLSSVGFQCDEESSIYVCGTAAESLARLGYEKDPQSVYMKASAEGFEVVEKYNLRT